MTAVATDLVVFAFDGGALRILLVRRAKEPFAGAWALPGGFLEDGETLEACAARELAEETGLRLRRLTQLAAFYGPDRDPRGDVLSVAYLALMRDDRSAPAPGGDAAQAVWVAIDDAPPLAFDHDQIVATAKARLSEGFHASPDAFDLLPDAFTLAEAQRLHECVLGAPIDKRNFRAWAGKQTWLNDTGRRKLGAHRPARLFERKADAP